MDQHVGWVRVQHVGRLATNALIHATDLILDPSRLRVGLAWDASSRVAWLYEGRKDLSLLLIDPWPPAWSVIPNALFETLEVLAAWSVIPNALLLIVTA